MSEVIIFGGTTEGRLLAEYCAEMKIGAVVCVVSGYGQQVLQKSPWLKISQKPMTRQEMVDMIREESPQMVLDATHPYAAVVTENVTVACLDTDTKYIRISREESVDMDMTGQDQVLWMDSVDAAVEFLMMTEGTVFVTTGSKELRVFTRIPDYKERIYARVLPGSENLNLCESLGICGKHVIGMQGPFSREMNRAMLRHTGAKYLVTKEAGAAGGFAEKIESAKECGVISVVIGRPKKPEGISVEQGKALLSGLAGSVGKPPCPVRMSLVGVGMGGCGQLTLEAVEALKDSEIVFGAPRMLRSIEPVLGQAKAVPYYLSKDIQKWLEHNGEYHRISVVYSGDTGFYSGARMMLEELRQWETGRQMEVSVYPGISTVAYLCSRLQISWEDAFLASTHGRRQDVLDLVENHKKVFLLLGGEDSVLNLCRKLVDGGYQEMLVSVGERLSYPDERIVTGTAKELQKQQFDKLAAVVLRRR